MIKIKERRTGKRRKDEKTRERTIEKRNPVCSCNALPASQSWIQTTFINRYFFYIDYYNEMKEIR